MKFYQILLWISRNIILIDHFGVFRQLIKTNIPLGAHSIICINTSEDEYTPRWNTMSCVCYTRVRSWIWKSSYKQQQQQQQHRVETTKIIRIFRIAKFDAKHKKNFKSGSVDLKAMSVPELSLKIKCRPPDRMKTLLRISLIKKSSNSG